MIGAFFTILGRFKRSACPKFYELDEIECNGKQLQLISKTAAKWKKIATRLHFDPSDIGAIENDAHYKAEPACSAVFSTWLGGKHGLREPITWATIVKVLQEIDHGILADKLNSVLID